MIVTPVSAGTEEGRRLLARLEDRFETADSSCQQAVSGILQEVRRRGDEALVEYVRKFDAPEFELADLRVTEDEFETAYGRVDDDFRRTLAVAIERVRLFHEREMEESWILTREPGVVTGRLVRPVDSAGLYVPGGMGGKTPLVSSVLMNGIPAGIAGVPRRVMVTPPGAGNAVSPALLVAAREIGIDEVYKVGSAWAIAALAFGTVSIPRVDVIVGPGNQYVTEAKRQVSGRVRIDMIAGPSEVLIVADESAPPAFVAADMLAQAEHDPQALAMAVVATAELGRQVVAELERQVESLGRREIALKSLAERGVILIEPDPAERVAIANRIGAEHLELMVAEPWEILPAIRHAGAIFMGAHAPEAVGDYLAGPNHVLPTMGTARFSSALGVETFLKKSSIISYTEAAMREDAEHIMRIAELEGLSAHAQSVAVRLKGV